ncbi:MAG: universal stress protein [Elusimicrobia bacterium]|nr:universal stress protein [Elusimicrobiota bacterium]
MALWPKKILVPVDMGELSMLALQYASAWAMACGGQLTILLVEDYHLPSYVGMEIYSEVGKILQREALKAPEKLRQFVQPYIHPLVKWECRLEKGLPAPTILGISSQGEFEAIVMGTHGRSGLRKWLLGSVAEEVIHGTNIPVLTVRKMQETVVHGGRGPLTVRNILCPVDDRPSDWNTLEVAGRLRRVFDAFLTVLKCHPLKEFESFTHREDLVIRKQRFLDALPPSLHAPSPEVLLRGGDAAEVILREADSLHSNLIVMGRGCRPFEGNAVVGTTALRVLRSAPCPVLIIPEAPLAWEKELLGISVGYGKEGSDK